MLTMWDDPITVLDVYVYDDLVTKIDLDDQNSKTVVMEVVIHSGMCKNTLF